MRMIYWILAFLFGAAGSYAVRYGHWADASFLYFTGFALLIEGVARVVREK